MIQNRIKYLLEKYYSGEISPDDYETLLTMLKEAKELSPELETERSLLLAIESYEPTVPDGFENKLSEAIERRYRKEHNIIKMLFSCAAVAVVLICVTIGMLNSGYEVLPDSEYIAGNAIRHEEAFRDVLSTKGTTAESEKKAKSVEMVYADKTCSSEIHEESDAIEISNEELHKAEQIVDEALLNMFATIHKVKNEVIESLDNTK